MPNFVYAQCPCGRALRASLHQGGEVVRCWDCHREVVMPAADQTGRLVRAWAVAASRVMSSSAALPLLGGAAALTALLLVPAAGTWLGLVALAAACARWYGNQVGAGELLVEPHEPPPGPDARPSPSIGLRMARWSLAAAAAAALAAPLLARNGGRWLPPATTPRGAGWLAAVALAGWAVMPLALLAAHAYGGRSPRRAMAAVARRPSATLAALLLVPAGLLAVEATVAGVTWEQGLLPLLTADMLPEPRMETRADGNHLIFQLDGTVVDAHCRLTLDPVISVYPAGLRRGFTLSATIPASLSAGSPLRQPLWMHDITPGRYLAARAAFSVAILWAAGLLLTIQARWLGVIAALGPPVRAAAPAAAPS